MFKFIKSGAWGPRGGLWTLKRNYELEEIQNYEENQGEKVFLEVI